MSGLIEPRGGTLCPQSGRKPCGRAAKPGWAGRKPGGAPHGLAWIAGRICPLGPSGGMDGPGCNVQDLCCLHVDAGEPVLLEERVSLGHHATVHGAHVEAGALIGIGAVVLGRSRIGAGSLVAAGAVGRPGTRVPAGVLFAGVPGRVIREVAEEDRGQLAHSASAYVARAARHRTAVWGEDPASETGGDPGI